MWWFDSDMNGWGYVLMTASMVLFWGLVIFGVVGSMRYLAREDRASIRPPRPEEVLAHRFAAGEIDEQEYQQRLSTLRRHHEPVSRA